MTAPHPLIKRLCDLRLAAGMSQREAERRAGLGKGTISLWEAGRYGAQVENLARYAALFGLTLALVPAADDEDDVLGEQLPYGQVIVGEGEKWCGGCKQVRSVRAFHQDLSRRDGLKSRCKYCLKERRERRARRQAEEAA